ncbi:MAG TPA: hypothetical protein VK846_07460 [Candidatus Limnocylindria bacterium]|nr:hypothetical protein [Candidatus Limnocylindria bacterium]
MSAPTPQQQTELIGAFILNFGAAEMATFQWITALTTDLVLRDVAIDMPLSKRIALVCQLVKRANAPEDKKARALEIWGEVAKLSETRNKLAHSPLCRNPTGLDEWGFIYVKKMKGIGPFQIEPLQFDGIARDGSRLAKLFPELLQPLQQRCKK